MTTPLKVLLESAKAVPSMRYAIAVAGLGAVVALILQFGLTPKVAVFGSMIVLGAMFMIVIFSHFARHHGESASLLALCLAWTFTIFVMASSLFLFSSFVFSWPNPINHYFGSDHSSHEKTQDSLFYFDFDEYSLTAETRAGLLDIADQLRKSQRSEAIIQGFASIGDYKQYLEIAHSEPDRNIDPDEAAQEIAEKRAKSVADFLRAQRVSESQLFVRPVFKVQEHSDITEDMPLKTNRIVKVTIRE